MEVYPRITDIPISEIKSFLYLNNVPYLNEQDAYKLAEHLIFSNKVEKGPNSIINWILAYNVILKENNNIGYYKISDIFILNNDNNLNKLSKQLGSQDKHDIIEMLDYMGHLVDDNVIEQNRHLELLKFGNRLYVCGKGTYDIKDYLKSLDGFYDGKTKCWIFDKDKRRELIDLVYTPNITQINNIPSSINLGLYKYQNEIIVCGKKTYDIKDKLKNLNAKFDMNKKCWIVPRNKVNEAIKIMEEKNNLDSLEKQRIEEQERLTREANLKEKELKLNMEKERQERMQIPEEEQEFIPHIKRLPPAIIQAAIDNNTFDDLYEDMEQEDAEELRQLWDDKIVYVRHKREFHGRGETRIITYLGDIKPPDIAMEYWMNYWNPVPIGHPGFSVRKIDHKLYEVHAFTTD